MLKTLTKYQTVFLPMFVARLAVVLCRPTERDAHSDAFRQALYEWLVHIDKEYADIERQHTKTVSSQVYHPFQPSGLGRCLHGARKILKPIH